MEANLFFCQQRSSSFFAIDQYFSYIYYLIMRNVWKKTIVIDQYFSYIFYLIMRNVWKPHSNHNIRYFPCIFFCSFLLTCIKCIQEGNKNFEMLTFPYMYISCLEIANSRELGFKFQEYKIWHVYSCGQADRQNNIS